MKRLIPILLIMVLLSGCSAWASGDYHHVVPHKDDSGSTSSSNVTVSTYWGLRAALANLVENGAESGIIFVPQYDQVLVEADIAKAVDDIMNNNPIVSYAVEEIECELGMNSGQSAIAVSISYLHDKTEILKISRVQNVASGKTVIAEKLDSCADSVVLYINYYTQTDFVQMVEDYANENPHIVMEIPEVKVNTYPESGSSRVVELKFIYQTSRELLRAYQNQVSRIFTSASLYVNSDAAPSEKLSQLYSFLMQLEDYEINTSITPAYSLLRHGQGDSKAFATVYAAMCRESGMNCQVVIGTRWGEAWYWNLVEDETGWHHVDILRCAQETGYQIRTDAEMEGYVWDYAAYPASTAPEESATEPSDSAESPETVSVEE